MRRFLTVLALALTVSCASTSSDAPRAHEHTFAFLRIGPKRGEITGEPLQELMNMHIVTPLVRCIYVGHVQAAAQTLFCLTHVAMQIA